MWKRLKKENFWMIFCKRLVVVALCAAFLLCMLLNIWFYAVRERLDLELTNDFYHLLKALDGELEESGNMEALREENGMVEFLVSWLGMLPTVVFEQEYNYERYTLAPFPATVYTGEAYGYLRDSETGEILTDSGKKGYISVTFKDRETLELISREDEERRRNGEQIGETVFLECPYVFVKEIDEELNSQGIVYSALHIKVLDFYVRGKEFRPGNVRVNGRVVDCTPEDTEGFAHLEVESGMYPALSVWGTDMPDENVRKRAEGELRILEYRKGGNRSNQGKKKGFVFYPGEMSFAMSRHFADGSGKEYDISAYYEIPSFFQAQTVKIRYLLIGFGILTLLISLLWARSAYLSVGAWIAMDDYRKTLIDSMAHDLKSPLMAMSGYAENLKENLHQEKQEYYADAILSNVSYMNGIIQKDLELSRTERLDQPLKKEKLDLTELAGAFLGRYEEEIKDRKLQVTCRGKCVIRGDRDLLERAMDNLIGNAVRHSSEGGVIEVSGSTHVFRIRNTTDIAYRGSLKKLWKPFVRWDESRGGQKGTGLGLSIADSVFTRHKWGHSLRYDKRKKMFECRVFLL